MKFTQPLLKGKLSRRYKRFFADVVLEDGREITAHCPNPGAMLGICDPGLAVWISLSDNPRRTLSHTLEIVEETPTRVGVNTMHPNKLVLEALRNGFLPSFSEYTAFRPEVRYGDENSRIDFLLEGEGLPPCYLEVKNVHLKRDGLAAFPDCVTARGAKHMRELARLVPQGYRSAVLFVIQRDDCTGFRPADEIDPAYAAALREAVAAGVEVHAWQCYIDEEEIRLAAPLQVVLG